MADFINLTDFDREQPKPIRFPNGHIYQVRPLDAVGYELCEEVGRTRDNAKAVELIRRILPDITDEDLGLFTHDRTMNLIFHARNQLDMVTNALKKNGSAPGPAPVTPSRPASKRKTRPAR